MKIPLAALFLLWNVLVFCQKKDKRLAKEITEAISGFKGQVGVYAYDLNKNKEVSVNAGTVFSTASMVKVPILIALMAKLRKGELDYHQQFVYNDSLLYAGVDILGSFKNGEKIELSKLIMLMLTMSDNTASLWLQSLAGGGSRINEIMDSLGFKETRVNSRTAGREGIRAKFGWGQTTPQEMATIFMKIATDEMFDAATSAKMLRLLSRNYWDEEAVSQIPAGIFVASKNGAVDGSRSEVLYVNGKRKRYVLCICTQNNIDTSWTPENEAWVMIKKVSKIVWEK